MKTQIFDIAVISVVVCIIGVLAYLNGYQIAKNKYASQSTIQVIPINITIDEAGNGIVTDQPVENADLVY
jgi:predicted Na+-dependent transporter